MTAKLIVTAAACALLAAAPAAAQTWGTQSTAGQGNAAALIKDLNALIDKGQSQNLADPNYLRELRALTTKYDWPWSTRLLSETFADGNYTANPAWTAYGDVRASWNGVRMVSIPQETSTSSSSQTSQQDPTAALMGAFLNQALGNKQSSTTTTTTTATTDAAALITGFALSNAFVVKLELISSGPAAADRRFEVGPFQNAQASDGYRLVYQIANGQPTVDLIRVGSRGSAVIDGKAAPALEGGAKHSLEWRRYTSGDMVVLVDGTELFRTLDRGYRSAFKGLTLTARAGDYTVTGITVDGQ